MVCNNSLFKFNPIYTTGSECNCLSSGRDGEKWGALSTMHAKQFWNLDTSQSFLAV